MWESNPNSIYYVSGGGEERGGRGQDQQQDGEAGQGDLRPQGQGIRGLHRPRGGCSQADLSR